MGRGREAITCKLMSLTPAEGWHRLQSCSPQGPSTWVCTPQERMAESVFLWRQFGCDFLAQGLVFPSHGGSLKLGPHLRSFLQTEGSLRMAAKSP